MVKKIVLTGGPCSGKTTVLDKIEEYYSKKGYWVIVVPETATELINDSIKDKIADNFSFQQLVLRMQLTKEKIVDNLIKMNENQNTIVLFDRGVLDGEAYVTPKEFEKVVKSVDDEAKPEDYLNRYDGVIVLIGDKSFYTLETNSARKENATEAIALGNRTLMSWIRHDNIKLVYPKEHMEDKTKEVIEDIDKIINDQKESHSYVVDLCESNINGILKNCRIYPGESGDIECKINFVVSSRVCCLEKYKYSNQAILITDTEIQNIPSLRELCILEEIECIEKKLIRGVK